MRLLCLHCFYDLMGIFRIFGLPKRCASAQRSAVRSVVGPKGARGRYPKYCYKRLMLGGGYMGHLEPTVTVTAVRPSRYERLKWIHLPIIRYLL